ncbi:nuclear transport factor 2 family protein [Conexibacter sp. SYSU D00693]|uniref:nuclear transport factor 2 family protein n=1 Tax=Conexibacter sp. SYSU D00693 TaxID=2812560 RepID=UPI00196B511B|nr:nuclear transport factor 2 family protein [Conexibacter sp. SYSU D00693]
MPPTTDPAALVHGLYAALAAGDRDTVLAALAPTFSARFADGMPAGAGPADGPEAALEHWWAIGRAFAVAAHPEEAIACAGERLLVRGRYRGTARADGRTVDAAFFHLWTLDRDGRLLALEQLTDTARWG